MLLLGNAAATADATATAAGAAAATADAALVAGSTGEPESSFSGVGSCL